MYASHLAGERRRHLGLAEHDQGSLHVMGLRAELLVGAAEEQEGVPLGPVPVPEPLRFSEDHRLVPHGALEERLHVVNKVLCQRRCT